MTPANTLTEAETADAFGGLGLFHLPPGRIATIVTYLAMRADSQAVPVAPVPGLHLARITGRDLDRHRAIFRRIGERWIWTSRLMMTDAELRTVLDDAKTQSFIVMIDGVDAGIFEVYLDTHEAELTFLGLDAAWTGRGIGPALIAKARDMAFAAGRQRLTVHTCHFDDPRALGFYQRMGFTPFRIAVETMDDPRLTGVLDPASAPHIPLIASA